MSTPIQLPVIVTSLSTKVDGSIKMTMETRELDGKDSAKLFDLRGTEAWVLVAPSEMKEEDVKLPTERADPAMGTKTPSQRLRGVLFRVWQQKNSSTDFESYYRVTLESLIDKYKEKLDA
jgi:hypothetical protein